MIYITGDCHGNFERFNASIFPEQNEMTKNDYVIICGDFGGVWNKDGESKMEKVRWKLWCWIGWSASHLQHYLWMGIMKISTVCIRIL